MSSERADDQNSRGPLSEETRDSEQTKPELGTRGPRNGETPGLVDDECTVVEVVCSNLTIVETLAPGEIDRSKNSSERVGGVRRGSAAEGESSNLAGESARDVTEHAEEASAEQLDEQEVSHVFTKGIMHKSGEPQIPVQVEEANRETEEEIVLSDSTEKMVEVILIDSTEEDCTDAEGDSELVKSGATVQAVGGRKKQLSRTQRRKMKIMQAVAAGKRVLTKAEQKKLKLEKVTQHSEDTRASQEQIEDKPLTRSQRRKMKKKLARAVVIATAEQLKQKLEEANPKSEISIVEAEEKDMGVGQQQLKKGRWTRAQKLERKIMQAEAALKRALDEAEPKNVVPEADTPNCEASNAGADTCDSQQQLKNRPKRPSLKQRRKMKRIQARAAAQKVPTRAEQKKRKLKEVVPDCEIITNVNAKKLKTSTAGKKARLSVPSLSKKRQVTGGKKMKFKGRKPRNITETFVQFVSGGFTKSDSDASVAEKVSEYGTGVSGREAEVAEEKFDSMRLAVVPIDFPSVTMTEEQAEATVTALANMVDPSDREVSVQFSATRYENGGLVFTCVDRAAKVWLHKTAPKIVPWLGACLTVGQAESILNGTKFVLLLPAIMKKRGDGQILNLFRKQNPGLCTAGWKVLSRVAEANNRERLTVWVDDKSSEFLKACSFKLFLGLSLVYLSLYSKWEKSVDSRSTVGCDRQPAGRNRASAFVRYRRIQSSAAELSPQNFPRPLGPFSEPSVVSLSPTIPDPELPFSDLEFGERDLAECSVHSFADTESPLFEEAQFAASDPGSPQRHTLTVSTALQSRFVAEEQPLECGSDITEQSHLPEASYIVSDTAQHREPVDAVCFAADCQHPHETGHGTPEPLQLCDTRCTDLDRLSPCDNRYTALDRLSLRVKRSTVWDRLSPRDMGYVGTDQPSPQDIRYIASDRLLPQGKRCSVWDRLSPRDKRSTVWDRLSPLDKRCRASDRLSPPNKRYRTSDRLSPPNKRYRPSDRLLPPDEKYRASDREERYGASDREERYGASDREERYGASDREERYGASDREERYGASDREERYGTSDREERNGALDQYEVYGTSDRLSPLDKTYGASNLLLSLDERYRASDREERYSASDLEAKYRASDQLDQLSPPDKRYEASDRGETYEAYATLDRLSPLDDTYRASDRLSPLDERSSSCSSKHTISDHRPSRGWYQPSDLSLASTSEYITPIGDRSPNSKLSGSDKLSDDCRSGGPHEPLLQESTVRGCNQVQYDEDRFIESRLRMLARLSVREFDDKDSRMLHCQEDSFSNPDVQSRRSKSSYTSSTHSRFPRTSGLTSRRSR